MDRGNNNCRYKEVKKPKKEKPKVLATADTGAAKPLSLHEKMGK